MQDKVNIYIIKQFNFEFFLVQCLSFQKRNMIQRIKISHFFIYIEIK